MQLEEAEEGAGKRSVPATASEAAREGEVWGVEETRSCTMPTLFLVSSSTR